MKLFNRVQFSTSTTGTSDIAVGAAVRSASQGDFVTPAEAGVQNGDAVGYVITDGNSFAFGRGIYSSTGPTLQRDANEVRWNGSAMSTAKLGLSGGAKVMFSAIGAVAPREDITVISSASSITPDGNATVIRVTALAANLTINAPTGTPYDGQPLLFELRDDGPVRTLTWNAAFGGGTLPANSGDGAVYQRNVLFRWNASRSKWVLDRTWDEALSASLISYVGGKTAISAAAGSGPSAAINSLTGGSNANPSAGDLIVVAAAMDGTSDLTLAMSSAGYTKVDDLYSDDTVDVNFAVFYKFWDGAEVTAILAGQTGRRAAIAVKVFRGVDTVTPLDVTYQQATGQNTFAANPPAVTPATAGAWVVACGGAGSVNSGDFTSGDLDNFISTNTGISSGVIVGMGNKAGTHGVALDPVAWGSGTSDSTSNAWAALSLVLRPKTLN